MPDRIVGTTLYRRSWLASTFPDRATAASAYLCDLGRNFLNCCEPPFCGEIIHHFLSRALSIMSPVLQVLSETQKVMLDTSRCKVVDNDIWIRRKRTLKGYSANATEYNSNTCNRDRRSQSRAVRWSKPALSCPLDCTNLPAFHVRFLLLLKSRKTPLGQIAWWSQ